MTKNIRTAAKSVLIAVGIPAFAFLVEYPTRVMDVNLGFLFAVACVVGLYTVIGKARFLHRHMENNAEAIGYGMVGSVILMLCLIGYTWTQQ